MKQLKISKDLALPVDAITQTFLVVGKRGSGKSNTAARLVEQFHANKLPFVVLDPTDTWYGVRSSRDGSGPGLDNVYVFGGRKADLPLEASAGALIAETLCEHKISMVLSVKHLSGRERSAFMVAFAMTLFQKWQGGPLHVVLEEAHELAPQMAGGRGGNQDNEAAMLGAFKRLWKLGRASGIGGTAVTQRPASLSKDITTQSEILIAHRTIGPQDVKAIGEWVKYHGQHESILGELPTLPTGEAFVWAPEFPSDKPIGLTKTAVFLRDTYDSASTPKVGETRVEPKELAPVDLERLKSKMAATVEKAKANDPAELKKQLAAKDKRINELEKATSSFTPQKEGKTVAALTDADRALLEKLAKKVDAQHSALTSTINVELLRAEVRGSLEAVLKEHIGAFEQRQARDRDAFIATMSDKRLERLMVKLPDRRAGERQEHERIPARGLLRETRTIADRKPDLAEPALRHLRRATGGVSEGAVHLKKMARNILAVLAQFPDEGCRINKIAQLTGYRQSGGFYNELTALRNAGFMVGDNTGVMRITAEGLEQGPFEALPSGRELVAYWLNHKSLKKMARQILAVLVKYPGGLTKDDIVEATGYQPSGGFFNELTALRNAGVMVGKNTEIMRISDELAAALEA